MMSVRTRLKASIKAALQKQILNLIEPTLPPTIKASDLERVFREFDILLLNNKNLGYELAQKMQPLLQEISFSQEPQIHHLVSKPCTQDDVESPWFAYWCQELKGVPIYHRKLWEFCFVLQVMFEQSLFRSDVKGIGFGCGREPLASYFARRGLDVTITDAPPETVSRQGWHDPNQYTASLDQAYFENLVQKEQFNKKVKFQYVDMNEIPVLSVA